MPLPTLLIYENKTTIVLTFCRSTKCSKVYFNHRSDMLITVWLYNREPLFRETIEIKAQNALGAFYENHSFAIRFAKVRK